MNLKKKLNDISNILKRRKFVRVEVETSCLQESGRFKEKNMLYLVRESFNDFPQGVTFYHDLEYKENSRNPNPVGVPKYLNLHQIEKLTILKTK